jgi:hypothetical protein
MSRIIAIESDPKRRRLLAMLVREHVKAELKIADTVTAAIALVDQKTPDLVIAPPLLSPRDESELMTHLRGIDAPYVQLLTMPALDMLGDAPRDERRGIRGWFSRRPTGIGPVYDRSMVGGQIVDALALAKSEREEYAASLVRRAEREEYERSRATALALIGSVDMELRNATADDVRRVSDSFRTTSDDRRVARRRSLADIGWLSQVRLGDGLDASLVNISTTGVLFESGSKFVPGSTSELTLSGGGDSMLVPVRFIRSEIARIDAFGVRYHAAATFDKEIDLSGPRRFASEPSTPPEALAQVLASALAESTEREPAHIRFVTGVRQLVGARTVQLHSGYVSPSGGRETLYFDVPGEDRGRMVLQVTFERGHDVSPSEFSLCRAAAWLSAAALEFDKPSARPVLLIEEAVA